MTTAALSAAPINSPASHWESDVGQLLEDLSSAQQELLLVLGERRELLSRGDVPGLKAVHVRELALVARLEACQRTRAELLSRAKDEQRPANSIASLGASLAGAPPDKLGKQVKESRLRMRLLQNESLTNWILAQRLLLHVSRLIEIIATGGRLKPTFAEGDSSLPARGALLNDEA